MNLRFWMAVLLGGWTTFSAHAQSFTSSNLPIFIINTNGINIQDDPKRPVGLGVIDNGVGKRNNLTDALNGYEGIIGIEYRGSSSQSFPKKPYGFETWTDDKGTEKNVSLLGFPSEHDWILNPNYNDKTMMRNVLVYWLANKMGRYATRTRYCEVMLNGSYEGVYVLQEKIKRDKNRVNISSIKNTDNTGDALTGGYIIKIDKTTGARDKSWNSPFKPDSRSSISPLFLVETPKYEDITETQFNYIKSYVVGFETALYSPDFTDAENGYRRYIDVPSFVDYFLLTELSKAVDGFRLSTYMYKDRDSKGGKLSMGPAWDYDIALGNGNYYDAFKPTGWQYKVNSLMPIPATPPNQEDPFKAPAWWSRLLDDPDFAKQVKSRWFFLRQNVFKTETIMNYIDSTATGLNESQERNFQRWRILGQYVWPNSFIGRTYQEEVNWLKDWIRQRLIWLDAQYEPFGIVTGSEPIKTNQLSVFPNPSTYEAIIEYTVHQRSQLLLTIHDLSGRVITQLAEGEHQPGEYKVTVPNGLVSSGVYLINYQLANQPALVKKWFKR